MNSSFEEKVFALLGMSVFAAFALMAVSIGIVCAAGAIKVVMSIFQ